MSKVGCTAYKYREAPARAEHNRSGESQVPSGTLLGMLSMKKPSLACALAAALLIAGCGGSSSGSHTSATSAGSKAAGASTSSGQTAGGSSGQGSSALSADARSAATGDIPDTQVFLVFTNKAAGYSMKYPEGWTQVGSGGNVTFRDKNNLVRVQVAPGSAPTPSSVAAQLNALKRSSPTLSFKAPQTVTIGSSSGVKAVYTTESAPDPVTGKRVKLTVDRYELAHAGHVATVEEGTPQGVDNIDAYRMMIQSFKWL
jgi:hypothetical protein